MSEFKSFKRLELFWLSLAWGVRAVSDAHISTFLVTFEAKWFLSEFDFGVVFSIILEQLCCGTSMYRNYRYSVRNQDFSQHTTRAILHFMRIGLFSQQPPFQLSIRGCRRSGEERTGSSAKCICMNKCSWWKYSMQYNTELVVGIRLVMKSLTSNSNRLFMQASIFPLCIPHRKCDCAQCLTCYSGIYCS